MIEFGLLPQQWEGQFSPIFACQTLGMSPSLTQGFYHLTWHLLLSPGGGSSPLLLGTKKRKKKKTNKCNWLYTLENIYVTHMHTDIIFYQPVLTRWNLVAFGCLGAFFMSFFATVLSRSINFIWERGWQERSHKLICSSLCIGMRGTLPNPNPVDIFD